MKNLLKLPLISLSFFTLMCLSTASNGLAGGGAVVCTNCSTWRVQALEKIEAVNQVRKQVEMIREQIRAYQNMVENTLSFPQQVWNDTIIQIREMSNLINEGQSLAYSIGNIDEEFKKRFKGYEDWLANQDPLGLGKAEDIVDDIVKFNSKFANWTKTVIDTSNAALNVANYQDQQFLEEDFVVSQIQAMSESAGGRMRATQAGVQMSGALVDQLQKLRQLTMTQISMQAAYQAATQEQLAQTKAQKYHFYTQPMTTDASNDDERF